MDRRALLAGSAAGLWAASARAQQACFNRLDCFDTQLPGPSLDLQFTSGGLDPRITFTRADATSCATYFNAAGTLTTVAANVPRFDYDPVTHAANGLLIEEARTNLLLNSATLGTQSVTVTAAATTLSFYGTGTVTLSGTFAGSLVGSGAFPTRSTLTFTPTAGSLTCTVTGSVLNAQVETGAFATSWISTAGTTATRAADVATMPVGAWFNPTAFSLAVEFAPTALTPTAYDAALSLDDGTNTNTVVILTTPTSNPPVRMSIGAGATGSGGVLSYTTTAIIKAALSVTPALTSGGYNGSINAPGATGTLATLATLRFGVGPGPAAWWNGTIRRVRCWPRALSSSELQSVTR